MRQREKIVLTVLAAVVATTLTAQGAPVSRRRLPRAAPRPRVGPLTLSVGETVSIGGFLYTVAYGLIPTGVTPVPIPLPVPIPPVPVPVPVPVPTPIPGPAPVVHGYRDSRRNPTFVFSPGDTVFIDGTAFGSAPGTVTVNNSNCPPLAWSDQEVMIVAPPLNSFPPGPVLLTVMNANKKAWTTSMGFTLAPVPGKGTLGVGP